MRVLEFRHQSSNKACPCGTKDGYPIFAVVLVCLLHTLLVIRGCLFWTIFHIQFYYLYAVMVGAGGIRVSYNINDKL